MSREVERRNCKSSGALSEEKTGMAPAKKSAMEAACEYDTDKGEEAVEANIRGLPFPSTASTVVHMAQSARNRAHGFNLFTA